MVATILKTIVTLDPVADAQEYDKLSKDSRFKETALGTTMVIFETQEYSDMPYEELLEYIRQGQISYLQTLLLQKKYDIYGKIVKEDTE